MKKYFLISAIVIIVILFVERNDLYYPNTFTLTLIDDDPDCDIEGSLFVIREIDKSDKKEVGKTILPVFEENLQNYYDSIYIKNHDSSKVNGGYKVLMKVKGKLSIFSNVESWYGCTGSHKFKIKKIVSITRKP